MGPKLKIVGAALAVLVTGLVVAGRTTPVPTVAAAPSVARPTDYDVLLDALDDRIESLRTRVAGRPDDWLTRQHLATALFERASLTHDDDDWARVQEVLDEAFAIAPEGSGPMLLAARFALAVHRLEAASSWLDEMDRRPLRRRDDVLAASVLRAQIAMQRGDHEEAHDRLHAVAAVMPAAADAELALWHAKTGSPERADALLVDALAHTSPRDARRRAWTMLQRGRVALDRGAYLQALQRFEEADAELSGWWLVQEHIAEAHDRLGQHGRAIAIYEALVRQHGLPQHLDALARARRHAGRDATDAIDRAAAMWAERLERWPEAAMGHAIENALLRDDTARAVELAEANHALRPGGDAKVALARAYLAAGRPQDALSIARAALRTAYRTAALHRVAADAHTALGDVDAAAEQRARWMELDPSCSAQAHAH